VVRGTGAAMIAALMVARALAANDGPKYTYRGLGEVPCAEFLASQSLPALKSPYIQWASGYVTSLAAAKGARLLRQMTITDVAVLLTTRCTEHPSESISSATLSIVGEVKMHGVRHDHDNSK
jgi:hypothetical protein